MQTFRNQASRHVLALQSAAAAGIAYLAIRTLIRRVNIAARAKSALIAYRKRYSIPTQIIFLRGGGGDKGKEEKTQILVVFLPGAFVQPCAYVGLCRAIQRAAAAGTKNANVNDNNAIVHVGIGSYFQNFPSVLGHEETKAIVDAVVAHAVYKLGDDKLSQEYGGSSSASFSFDAIFIAGHSVSVIEVMTAALPSQFDGAILLGGTSNSAGRFPRPVPSRSLASYPKPALTVVGDRDGFIRHWELVDELENLDRYADSASGISTREAGDRREELDLDKPIICLPEVNHMQVADGVVANLTAKTGRSDLDSYLSLDAARDMVGSVVADFIVYHANGSEERGQSLILRARKTREALRPFRTLSESCEVHRFIHDLQRDLLNLVSGDASETATLSSQAPGPPVCAHWHETKEDFLYSKPSVSRDGIVHVHVMPQPPLFKTAHPPQLSPTLAIKWKSQEGVLSLMSGSDIGDRNPAFKARKTPPPSLADLNRRTFDRVLNKIVSPQQRERYLKRDLPLTFLPDMRFDMYAAPVWVDTPIELTYDEHGTYLRSPCVITPANLMPAKFAGMLYGKPLSPAQAYEYIVFDAFKSVSASGG